MSSLVASPIAEGVIWDRMLRSSSKPLSLDAARYFLRMQFAQEDQERMRQLAAKAREGVLTKAEQNEIRNYEHVGNLLALMKSQARRRLKKLPSSNGSGR